MAIVGQWFSREERGMAMGIYGTALPLATMLAFNILGRVEVSYHWYACFWATFAVNAVALAFFFLLVREKSVEKAEMPFEGLKNAQIWFLAIVAMSFNMATLSFTT